MADQVGDSPVERKYFENETTHDSRDYKYSMEAQIRILKYSCEYWKEIMLHTKDVFLWKKQWYPTAIISGSTTLFMLLWLLDPSVLTVVAVLGLFVTICDYVVPSIAGSVFKPESWTARKDQEFEDLCTDVVLYRARMQLAWGSYYRLKTTNRKMYLLVTTVTLGILAWIGCTFNNLFLAYVLVTFTLLLPGMEHNGIIKKSNSYLRSFLNECLKIKSGQKKD